MKTKKIILYCVWLNLVSCIGSAAYDEPLVDNYSLNAMDVKSGMTICGLNGKYRIGIMNPTVFAVGFDDEFIIAKQHPEKDMEIDRSITNYFIIPLKEKISESIEKNVVGPMTKEEFYRERKKLGVSKNLIFTKKFKDLE